MTDKGDIEDGDDEDLLELDEEPTKPSQAKVAAELVGIVLKSGQRTFALKIESKAMIDSLAKIWKDQRNFLLTFRVPAEKSGGKVTKWKVVEFPTMLIDLALKSKGAVCHGHIDHAGACAMSELILNWKGGIEFLLDGVQQKMF